MIGIVSEDIVTFSSGDMAWLVACSLALLASSVAVLALALPDSLRRDKIFSRGRLLLYLASISLTGIGPIAIGQVEFLSLDAERSASLAMATS